MSTTTAKLGLIKPELTDPADITALNANWDKLDSEIAKKANLDEDGKIPTEQLPEFSSAKTYVVTLSASGWHEGDDGRFQQGVSIAGVKADSPIVFVDVDLSVDNLEVKKLFLEAWASVSANEVEQYDGAMLFYAWEQPTVSIPVNVGVM